ncbi:23S rRNA (guanosine(2251)-2'-O)-methyltransferase RlmB [Rhodococcus aerolatus]
MAGNSRRRGAVRKATTKKGPVVGSGGVRRRGLEARGATPPKEQRTYHPAAKRARKAAAGSGAPTRSSRPAGAKAAEGPEVVLGRNPVVECLRAGVPATALYVAVGTESDERLDEAVRYASEHSIAILEVPRTDLDRMSANKMHQGVALQVPAYTYAHPDDLLSRARRSGTAPLVVALDNITDPRNLGAVIRSVSAFGGHGVLIPQRRSASVSAVAWRTSAGTAARLPVARAVNLTRALKDYAAAGLQVVGLDAAGPTTTDDLAATGLATGPLVVVVGSEGKGLSRLVAETCDTTVGIPMAGPVESLNASVAAGVVLAEVARLRRLG